MLKCQRVVLMMLLCLNLLKSPTQKVRKFQKVFRLIIYKISENDGGPFSYPMKYEDIFEPEWDFSTDLHIVASLGQHIDTSALG